MSLSHKTLFMVPLGCAIIILAGSAGADSYYVSTSGNDSSDGTTITAPFLTIQKAARVAGAGSIVYVRGGTYRETVTPAHSGTTCAPITFRNYNGESVTICGADLVSGSWSAYSGSIYKTNVGALDFDQLFVDGKMNLKAQWPNNGSLDPFNKSCMATVQSGTTTSLTDNSMPIADWSGGKLWMLPGLHWVGFDRVITTFDPSSRTVDFGGTGHSFYAPGPGDRYYVFDKLEALDTVGEWFLDKTTHDLYLWTTSSDSPARHAVEVKTRAFALDVSNKGFISFDGINFVSGSINLSGSTSCSVKNGSIKYPDYFENADGYVLKDCGVVVSGTGNVLDHLEIAYTPGAGINVSGVDNQITYCTLHDIDWTGGEYGAITYGIEPKPDVGQHRNIMMSHNKIHKTGRSGFLGHYSEASILTYNDVSDVGVLCNDLGVVYVDKDGGMGGIPSVIAYNRFHDNNGTGSAIYFDSYTGEVTYTGQNYIVHHNIIYNISPWAAFHVNGGADVLGSRGLSFYNNTTWNCTKSIMASCDRAGRNFAGMTFESNIVTYPLSMAWYVSYVDVNNFTTGDPLLVSPSTGDFRLQSGSPCIDASAVITSVTGEYIGSAPDIGALEYSGGTTSTKTPAAAAYVVFDPRSFRLAISHAGHHNIDIVRASGAIVARFSGEGEIAYSLKGVVSTGGIYFVKASMGMMGKQGSASIIAILGRIPRS